MVEWWHWIVVGIILTVSELFLFGFFVIWFGISATLVGITTFFITMPLSYQIIIWTIGSILLLWIWFMYLKIDTKGSRVGQSDEYKDIVGEIREVMDRNRYRATFDIPILGDRDWIVETDDEGGHKDRLKVGDRISVYRVYGQLLKVKKLDVD
jgi:membrane protein implicated in regulation of membrane protease activity